MKEKLYAHRIEKRAITIMDVPKKYRDAVLDLLGESDRERNEKILAEAATA